MPPLSAYDNRPSPRTRLAALLLAAGVIALMLATLIAMGMLDSLPGGPAERLTAVRLSSASRQPRPKAAKPAATEKRRTAVVMPRPVAAPVAKPKAPPLKLIALSKAEFAASDISKLSRHADDSAANPAAAGNSASTYGPGDGPGGARMYNAEWYREPSHAELAGYMTANAPPGSWAVIACKTIDHFHVEDCRQLGESPPGSGLSRALRQAAWQFLVRPPRIDGKPVIGAWVRIRFDFTGKREPDGG